MPSSSTCGWKLDDPWAYRYFEACQELGIRDIHIHKGPTIRPLDRVAFGVADVDHVATDFTDLNFIVEHCVLPRLEGFSRIATQEPNVPGAIPFAHVRAFADSVQTVSEEALSRALLLCMERAKLIVEPAGAAAVAALMTSAPELALHGPVCAVLSGGNIDPLVLTHVITHGLRAAGRYLAVKVTIPDRPGGLSRLLGVVSESAASVLDVVHSRTAPKLALDEVEVMLTVETRGPAHREKVLAALGGAGFVVSVEDH